MVGVISYLVLASAARLSLVDAPRQNVDVESLIDQLAAKPGDQPNEKIGEWGMFFAPAEDPNTIFLRHGPVQVNPAMLAILKAGPTALPNLLAHLDDHRPTDYVINQNGATVVNMSDFYAYRDGHSDEEFSRSWRQIKSYNFKVGDLCFDLLGQILGSGMSAAIGIPSDITVVTAPTESPQLAEKVRDDWGGYTAEDFREDLINRSIGIGFGGNSIAIMKLLYFFPDAGEPLVLKLISRDLYNNETLSSFIWDRLLSTDDEMMWKTALSESKSKFGKSSEMIPFWIDWMSHDREEPQKHRGTQLLATFYPEFKHGETHLYSVCDLESMNAMLDAVRFYKSSAVDKAGFDLFKRALLFKDTVTDDNKHNFIFETKVDELAEIMAYRASTPESHASYKQYLDKRIAEQKADGETIYIQSLLKARKVLD